MGITRQSLWKVFSAVSIILSLFFLSAAASPPSSDALINKNVKRRLMSDRSAPPQKLHVETQNGVVNLKGIMDAKTQAVRAIEIAESTPGVVKVNTTQLFVKDSHQPLQDMYITAKIKGLYWKDHLMPGSVSTPAFNVQIETQNGVVYLSGWVQNKTQAQKAIELAHSIEGVQRVESSLKIKA